MTEIEITSDHRKVKVSYKLKSNQYTWIKILNMIHIANKIIKQIINFILGTKDHEQDSGHPAYIVTTEITQNTHGLFKYTPLCCRKAFLSAAGLLFFLSWGSTMQVKCLLPIFIKNVH